MSRKDAENLRNSFRSTREQEQVSVSRKKPVEKSVKTAVIHKPLSDPYGSFLKKYYSMSEETVLNFTAQELLYFFKEVARRAGYKYVISNISRDTAVFKKLKKDYDNVSICLMIEFIFESGQNYINSLQPTVLISELGLKIYEDSRTWNDDKYVPPTKQIFKPVQHTRARDRQFITEDDNFKRKTRIGVWGDE
jgi:hypothetical protein